MDTVPPLRIEDVEIAEDGRSYEWDLVNASNRTVTAWFVGHTILFEDGQTVCGARGTDNYASLDRTRPAVRDCAGAALQPGDRCRLRDEAFAVRSDGNEAETNAQVSIHLSVSGERDQPEWNRVRAVSITMEPVAVVFADMTTWGDPARLAKIFEWRRDALRQHTVILDALSAARQSADDSSWLGRAVELLDMEGSDRGVHVQTALFQLRTLVALDEAGAEDLAERCELFVSSQRHLHRATAHHARQRGEPDEND